MKWSFVFFCTGSMALFNARSLRNKRNINSKIDGIIFGETGVNFAYQLGIMKYMQKTFRLDGYKFCGISGGCNCAFILVNKIDVDHFFHEFVIQTFNRKNKNKFSSVFEMCHKAVHKLYKSKCGLQNMNDKLYVSMTKVFPYWHNHTVCRYRDFTDMLNSIKASQYIPFIFGHPYTFYNKEIYIDGFFSSYFHYKPTDENWVSINLRNFRVYYFLTSIVHLGYLFDQEYHERCYSDGYLDAKKQHAYFLRLGFKVLSEEVAIK